MDKKLQKTLHNTIIDRARFMASLLPNLSVISLKDFIELNVNMDMIIKNVNFLELNRGILTLFLNIQTLKMI